MFVVIPSLNLYTVEYPRGVALGHYPSIFIKDLAHLLTNCSATLFTDNAAIYLSSAGINKEHISV